MFLFSIKVFSKDCAFKSIEKNKIKIFKYTGRSVAPHLHYEILKDGKKINPINYYYGNLSPEEYSALVIQASLLPKK